MASERKSNFPKGTQEVGPRARVHIKARLIPPSFSSLPHGEAVKCGQPSQHLAHVIKKQIFTENQNTDFEWD